VFRNKLRFVKSTFSLNNQTYIEVAKYWDRVLIRDSKNLSQHTITVPILVWNDFLEGIKNDEFDF